MKMLSNKELADLNSKWINSKVSKKYCDNVLMALEVDEQIYKTHMNEGGLCQEKNGKYYIA